MHPKYQEVIKLRLKGKSYREIAKTTGVSKSSISEWCKTLKLPTAIQKILKGKTKATRISLENYNRRKHKAVQANNKEILKNAIKQIPSLSKQELLLIGAALYWGEGYKRQDKTPSPYVGFANSDPKMIALFLCFLRKVMRVPEEKLKARIFLHSNIEEKPAINFWSKATNIPKEKFHITRQTSKASQGKRPSSRLPYGTLNLRLNSRKEFFQIKGWIEGLKLQIGQK